MPLPCSSSPHQTRFAGLWRGPQYIVLARANESPLRQGFAPQRLYGVFTPPGLAGQKDSQILFLQLSLLSQSLHLIGKAPQVDEALGVLLVVVALLKGDQVLGVQGLRRGDGGGDDIAL